MRKAWLTKLKIIIFYAIPLIFLVIAAFGNFGASQKGYLLLSALVFSGLWYLAYLLKTEDDSLKPLRHYFFFLFKQLPNILQIITFAGFVTILYEAEVKAAHAISLLTTVLTCLYLTMSWRDYFTTLSMSKTEIEKLDNAFRLFTVILFQALMILLLKATSVLLA